MSFDHRGEPVVLPPADVELLWRTLRLARTVISREGLVYAARGHEPPEEFALLIEAATYMMDKLEEA